MKIEILRIVLPVVVGLVVPVFFLVVYLSSCLSRLEMLRRSCRAEMAGVLELLRGRWLLATKVVEQLRQRGAGSQELARLETAVAASSVLSVDPNRPRMVEGRIQSLDAAGAELEQALVSLLRPPGESPVRPPDALLTDLHFELGSNQAATRSASVAYNQAVARYTEARHRFPVRLFARLCGFVPLGNLPVRPELEA